MFQPPQIAIEERPQIRDAVFQHRQPVDADAEGEALPFVRVDPGGFQHLRVHHAGPEDFHPVVALAHVQLAAFPRTAQVDLGRRFGEGEVRGAESQIDMVDLEAIWHEEDLDLLNKLITRHEQYTGSRRARFILDNWSEMAGKFVKVMPVEYRRALERLRESEEGCDEYTPFTEEVFSG